LPTPDIVTAALLQDAQTLVASLGGEAFMRARGEAALLFTRVPLPTMNSVLTVKTSAAVDDVAALLEVVAGAGVPHAMEIRPGTSPDITALARSRGLVEEEPTPLMVMHSTRHGLREAAEHPRLRIRLLEPDEVEIHCTVAAGGFEAPPELFQQLVGRRLLELPGQRAYVGTVDGEPVSTALSSTLGGHVGIFDVATPPAFRGQGYGAAITARAALDGFASGAVFAYLQSSPAGYAVYERLGFRTLETWSIWVSAGSPSHS
jgi:predicted GNAT family acetyltransferase